MAKVIAIFNGKGGVGKSTVAACLGVSAKKSVLIDLDPQATLSTWGDRRAGVPPEVISVAPSRTETTISRSAAKWIILDTPGALITGVADALRCADLILVPTSTRQFDLDELPKALDVAAIAGKPIAILLNRIHPTANAEAAIELVSDLGVEVAPVLLRERISHDSAASSGLIAAELEPQSHAAEEIAALWQWVKKQV